MSLSIKERNELHDKVMESLKWTKESVCAGMRGCHGGHCYCRDDERTVVYILDEDEVNDLIELILSGGDS